MKPPLFIIPESISNDLDSKNPNIFQHEDHCHLFGIKLPAKIDCRDTFLISHTFTAKTVQKSWGLVSTVAARDDLQIIHNALTLIAKALNFDGTTIGNWHSHPDGMYYPSSTDLEAYRKSASTAGLGFWLAPIASRKNGRKTTKWHLFLKDLGKGNMIFNYEYVRIYPNSEIFEIDERLESFIRVRPEHILSHTYEVANDTGSETQYRPYANHAHRQALDVYIATENKPPVKSSFNWKNIAIGVGVPWGVSILTYMILMLLLTY